MSEGSEARTRGHMMQEGGRERGMGKGRRDGTESLGEGAEIPWERSGDTEVGNGLMKVNKARFLENYW